MSEKKIIFLTKKMKGENTMSTIYTSFLSGASTVRNMLWPAVKSRPTYSLKLLPTGDIEVTGGSGNDESTRQQLRQLVNDDFTEMLKKEKPQELNYYVNGSFYLIMDSLH